MRKIYRHTFVISAALCAALPMISGSMAYAQTGGQYDVNGQPIFLPNTSSSYNQQGFNLPSAPSRTGQDIVRGSGGISCQSAINTGGPQLDMGVIGTNDIFDRDSAALYGRITMPLGKRPKRVDCTKLYDLEIARLKMELQLMRAGALAMEDEGTAREMMLKSSRGQTPTPKVAQIPAGEEVEIKRKGLALGPPPGQTVSKPAVPLPVKMAAAPVAPVNAAPNLRMRTAPAESPSAKWQDTLEAGIVRIANYGEAQAHNEFYAQIGAFSSIENAKNAWWTYTKKVPGKMNNYTAIAKPKRKGDKTLYLLQAGPFTKQDTKTLCTELGNGCYPVKT